MSAASEPKGRHSVTLGSSMTDVRSAEQHVGLRFNFQPGTMDRARAGYLSGGPEEYTVAVPNTSDTGSDHIFTGAAQSTKDLDCVLIYDEATSSYRLEHFDGIVRLDHQRGKSGHRKTASTASLASPFVPYNIVGSSPAHLPSSPGAQNITSAPNAATGLASSPAPPAVATPAAAHDDLDDDAPADEVHDKKGRAIELQHGRRTATSTPPPRIRLETAAKTSGVADPPESAAKPTKGTAQVKKTAPAKAKAKAQPKPKSKAKTKAPVIAARRADIMEDELDYGDDSDEGTMPVDASSKSAPATEIEEDDDDDDLDDLANMLESTLEESPPDTGLATAPADESSEDED
ncbi:RNA polymerase II transcription elongation factor-domain-containing protein [Protomyces lactucae-debilis]|uniref:RNA polymerase II transcription elongation factor-domain-containing protein n=1 Tax=Protomyces lactucae-debilis TaxID=2754530 RepID=A0A1Y2F1P9_PROLT|nr:RNA polymerase II transcription elongation factor-domain-containing protein [Protomyces lactucae-debilis]ORY77808.1 RNA polymerase II transcription elongation factor-domain-containing protein [Protomyces lactucae-debilis]